MSRDLILAIDQGTTSTRAIAFDGKLRVVASAVRRLHTRRPQPGWAEQDPEAILESVTHSVRTVLDEVGGPGRIAAAGLDNQGETVVAWDVESGRALAPAVLWQCRRSQPIVERLRSAGLEPRIRALTGLPLDAYFSAGKLTWLLEQSSAVQMAAARHTLRFGTVDAWLTARLDNGAARTDVSTASRTQLLRIDELRWDDDLLSWFGVARETLPTIVPSAGDLGQLSHASWGGSLPLRAMACDQQAALAGHAAFTPGAMKATLGTGVFLLANAGESPIPAPEVETSVGWLLADGRPTYVLQGGVFTAGAFVGWLRDEMHLIADDPELDQLATSVPDTAGVRVLPALAGLGAPWWRAEARAVIAGASAAAGRAHVARATLDGIANLTVDVIQAMTARLPVPPSVLRVDGGLTSSRHLVQRLADLSGRPVDVASAVESTALGIAGLAAIGSGLADVEALAAANPVAERLEPSLPHAAREAEREAWRRFADAAAGLA